jgi:alkanesulfonate monooxygenase SsuD/methylene tetrahydromethanopterin reductase-like flavin-dependent oxidoreductase (luciferase family)
MEFGWYHEFHRQVEGQSDADAFDQGFQQVEAADRWGLDVFWLAEIHQQARRSVLSAPMNVAGQIAARTKRIKIGTAVHVLPLNHPLRLAEETATVDQVSRGRFILGAGRSDPRGYA